MPEIACPCGNRFIAPTGEAICPSCGAVQAALRFPPRAPAAWTRSIPPPKSDGWRSYIRWVLAAALIPLLISSLAGHDDTEARWERTLKDHPEVMNEIKSLAQAKGEELTKKDVLRVLPGKRIEGAYLSSDTMAHWLYAVVSAAAFWGFILLVYPVGNATSKQLWTVGIFTGTIGILLLLGLQWAAFHAPVTFRGGGKLGIILLLIKMIGFSYAAALGDTNFVFSMIGFFFGVGLCEELCKALPLFFHYRQKATLDLRGAVVWGLASGIGFGVSEGITYSSDMYNGLTTGGIYVVRFVSCVALHAVWSACSAILIWRRQSEIRRVREWYEWFVPIFKTLGISMALHALYDTALKKEMEGMALVTAIASFAFFFWIYERARKQEPAFVAGATA